MDESVKQEIKGRLRKAWCRETSYHPGEWTPENPSRGHCGVVTAYQMEHMGAKGFFAHAVLPDGAEDPGGHFFGEIDGRREDWTEDQFPPGTVIVKCREVSLKFLLRKPDTRRRYNLMTQRLEDATLAP